MHEPLTIPRESIYYDYQIHPFVKPPELSGKEEVSPVTIVGAGPVGLLLALMLARWGVRSIILESELQVSYGSRALCLTRPSMEILQQAGVVERFLDKSLPWHEGRSFYKGEKVYDMLMPHDPDDRFMPGNNIQQQFIEEFLIDAARDTGLIDIRWGSRVLAVEQDDERVKLRIDTPEGEYEHYAQWAVAADGGNSTMRKLLGLRMEGRAYSGKFVIADILAPVDLPTERLCYFDPEWNPGNNVLVHRAPQGIWRIDFRLPDGETEEEALEQRRLSERIDRVLEMIGQPVKWELDWSTVYSASTLTLPDFREGRVLFVGDAAHLLPIFGVRGANTGFQEAANLGWKMALVAKGLAGEKLLDSYSQERVPATREICDEGGKSTRFMTPPSRGFRLLRDAVLSLSLSEHFCRDLLHWRTSRPHKYVDTSLSSPASVSGLTDAAISCGEPIRNVHLSSGRFLFDLLTPGFHLFVLSKDSSLVSALVAWANDQSIPISAIVPLEKNSGDVEGKKIALAPEDSAKIAEKWGSLTANVFLVRPDLHVAATLVNPNCDDLDAALCRATSRNFIKEDAV